jgi:hypothetical protein
VYDELLSPTDGNGILMAELHGERCLTYVEKSQAKLIFREFLQGHKRWRRRAFLSSRYATARTPAEGAGIDWRNW